MRAIVDLHGRPVEIDWSAAAERALNARSAPLRVEMELYFSCMIRKRVRFEEQVRSVDLVPAGARLQIAFRPVMTRACAVADYDEVPLTDFPIINASAFVPHWLTLDFKGQVWSGTFGFRSEAMAARRSARH
ncbi:MAG: hypothetical protein ACYCQK_10555 [Acidiferrobacteraceae bacterium]